MASDGEKAASVLAQRVAQRVAELRLTARQASLNAGLGPDAVRTILTGRSRSPRARNLAALARELQCDVGYLLGTQDEPIQSIALTRLADDTLVGVAPLIVRGQLRLGWDGLDGAAGRLDECYVSDVPSLPQYLPGAQHLEIVADNSFDIYFRQDTLVHVLFTDFEQTDVREGDIVVLVRQRLSSNQGVGWIERSLRIARRTAPDILFLESAPTSPSLRTAAMWEGPEIRPPKQPGAIRLNTHLNEALQIEGLVLRSYYHVSGPPIRAAGPMSEQDAIERVTGAARRT